MKTINNINDLNTFTINDDISYLVRWTYTDTNEETKSSYKGKYIYKLLNEFLETEYINNIQITTLENYMNNLNTVNNKIKMDSQLLAAPETTHFKRHGFRNSLRLIKNNDNYNVEIIETAQGYLLKIEIYDIINESRQHVIKSHLQEFKDINIINVLPEIKKVVEMYLKLNLNIDINIDISFIETYYIPFAKLTEIDKHLYEFHMFNGSKITFEVLEDDTIDYYNKKGIDIQSTLKATYRNFTKIEDVFNNLYADTRVIDLFKFIHDNNYKQDFRENFIKYYSVS